MRSKAHRAVPTLRLETFSDGVFAISITLLVLEIKVPEHNNQGLAHSLTSLWPSYAAFAVSFLTIGIIWINHHSHLNRVVRVDRPLMFLNIILLLTVSFIPFPTAVMAHYLRDAHGQYAAAALYSGTFLASGMALTVLWTYVTHTELVHESISTSQRRVLFVRNLTGGVGYMVALICAFFSAGLSLILCALVATFYALPNVQRG